MKRPDVRVVYFILKKDVASDPTEPRGICLDVERLGDKDIQLYFTNGIAEVVVSLIARYLQPSIIGELKNWAA